MICKTTSSLAIYLALFLCLSLNACLFIPQSLKANIRQDMDFPREKESCLGYADIRATRQIESEYGNLQGGLQGNNPISMLAKQNAIKLKNQIYQDCLNS